MLTCFEPGGLLWLLSGKPYEQQKPKRLGAEQRLHRIVCRPDAVVRIFTGKLTVG